MKKKRRVSGSKKGGKFERKLCKKFSLWASDGLSDDWFWRTPSSGGRATERIKKGLTAKDYAGDMLSLDIRGRPITSNCMFEFKSGYSKDKGQKLSITTILDKLKKEKTPLLIKWWEKLEKERIDHQKNISLLVFKRDRKRRCVVVDSRTWLLNFKFSWKVMPEKYTIIRYKDKYLVILLLKDFFKYVKPEWLYNSSYIAEEPEYKLKVRRPYKLKYRRKNEKQSNR